MYRRSAFVAGLERLGYKIEPYKTPLTGPQMPRMTPESTDDVLVLWNLKRGYDEAAARRFELEGGTVLVVENGYLQKTDKSYYAISTHAHNGAGWYPVDASIDRFGPLGFQQKPWLMGREHILICAQRGVGSAEMASPLDHHVRAKTSLDRIFGGQREVRMRMHPGNFVPQVPLEADLARAWACVGWSTASGVRALVEGVPVFQDSPHWICADVARRVATLKRDTPMPGFSFEKVSESLNRMSWGQWKTEEIEAGTPFDLMRSQGWGPRWL
jgi:hypothetical protein